MNNKQRCHFTEVVMISYDYLFRTTQPLRAYIKTKNIYLVASKGMHLELTER